MRRISYAQAINEALHQLMDQDERVLVIGQGVTSPWYVGTTTAGLIDRFGERRVIDTPVSENGITGIATGAALGGMRPLVVHPRMDFMYYAMDQIANHIANWYFMLGGTMNIPLVIWGIVNRGGEQAAQHSQALQAIFTHIPGLKVVVPSHPYDAKGLLVSAVTDDNPVVYIDDRWLYDFEGEVPNEMYQIPIGKAAIRREGQDITIAAISYMVSYAMQAAEQLTKEGLEAEVLDMRSLKPFDKDLLLVSVRKTGRLVVADGGWKTCGISAEIAALAFEEAFASIKSPVVRVALPDAPAPASSALEKGYYPGPEEIIHAVQKVCGKGE